MSVGTFTIHRFNGDEIYALTSALVFANAENSRFRLEVDTDSTPIKTLPDTQDLFAQPNAEVEINAAFTEISDLVGQRFAIPYGSSEDTQSWLAHIYYCEHEDINNNEVEILGVLNGKLHIKWMGTTVDVNFYDGSKPVARIEIDGWFTVRNE